MGLGAVVIGLAVLALLVWASVIVNSRRARPTADEEPPQNLTPFLTDDEMESKRISKVLVVAVISAAVLALVVPLYYIGESDRQAEAAEGFLERDIEEGAKWFDADHFQCITCHGAGGTGGSTEFVEPRSGITTQWIVPSLNDVFYRYTEDEVRFWIEFGRRGTPMPPQGLEGGGSLTSQQVDQILAYLRSIQIPQDEAVGQVETRIGLATDRIDRGAETVAEAIADAEATVVGIEAVPAIYQVVEDLPDRLAEALAGDGSCTDESAGIVAKPCESAGADSDRDDISDEAELRVSNILAEFVAATGMTEFDVVFDPADAFSTSATDGTPLTDLSVLDQTVTDLDIELINLRVIATSNDVFVANAEEAVTFMEASADARRWEVDFDELAARAFDGDVDQSRRAVGLFNAYCARCHTAGYSAGVAFEQPPGSGAWGPSLLGGKAVRQFPDPDAHFNFIVQGSERATNYGINGLGNGFMPAFGTTLSRDDIMLIVQLERAL